MSQPAQDPYAHLGFLGTEGYAQTRRQSVPLQPPWQSVPPQPPFGQSVPPHPPSGQGVPPQPQGALPPPLGQSALQARLPTSADLDLRRQGPAAISPVQSAPQPPQQHQQQQQQEGYGQRPQLPGDGFYYQPQRASAMGYGGQGQYGNMGTRQYTPAQTFESSYYPGVTPRQGQNPGQPPPGEYGPRQVG